MPFDPSQHHRHSIRLEGYDYSDEGAYFVTICAQDRAYLFGDVVGVEMRMSDPGRMIEKWWFELPTKYPGVELDEHVVMPNHFHGILLVVGAHEQTTPQRIAGAALHNGPNRGTHPEGALRVNDLDHEPAKRSALGDILDWYKTMTTNEYIRGVKDRGWPRFRGRVWQRNYHEHVVRNRKEWDRIRQYILENPARWPYDRENPNAVSQPQVIEGNDGAGNAPLEPWRV